MLCFAPIRFAAAASLALVASLPAQSPHSPQTQPTAAPPLSSTLPATPPTTPDPPPVPLTPSQRPPDRAQISYADGTISISANNSSLNQILRQIGSDTGMKITGGVTDERVFGHYGPADPAQILAELLDGTGSNMILVQRDAATPAELILTPRPGGPTPPNPTAHAFDDRPDRPDRRERPEPQEAAPAQAMQPEPAPNGPPVTPATNPGTPAGTSPANPESPNGVKTPQQIYEQLQRLRSQQQSTTQPQ
jgi:hypothetical protein